MPESRKQLHLRVMSLADQTLSEKVFQRFPVTIGREPTSDLVIDCGHVSRAHATIDQWDDYLLLTDVGSFNGTRVQGEKLSAHTPYALRGTYVTFFIGPLLVQGWHEHRGDPRALLARLPSLFEEGSSR